MRLPWVAAMVLLAPVGLTYPTHHDGSYHGVATQGSADVAAAWHEDIPCMEVISYFTLVLEVGEAHPADSLLLETRGAGNVLATKAEPAVAFIQHLDSCPHFIVHGLHVRSEAAYRVRVCDGWQPCGLA